MTNKVYEGEIRNRLANDCKLTKVFARQFSNEFFNTIRQGLLDDGYVRLHQFGSLRLKWSKERKGIHPQTGEPIIIPAQPRIQFTTAKNLKDTIQNSDYIHTIAESCASKTTITAFYTRDSADELSDTNDPAPFYNSRNYLPDEIIPESAQHIKKQSNHKILAASMMAVVITGYILHSLNTAPITTDNPGNTTIALSTQTPTVNTISDSDQLYINSETVLEQNGSTLTEAQPATAINTKVDHEDVTTQTPTTYLGQASDTQTSVSLTTETTYEAATTKSSPANAVQISNTVLADTTASVPEATNIDHNSNIHSDSASLDITAQPLQASVIQNQHIVNSEATAVTTSVYFKERPYKLKDGNSLWRLSQKNYINPFYWPHIYQANRYKINNPDKLHTGKIITLPTLYGHPEKLTDQDKRNIAEGYFLAYQYYKSKNTPQPYFALLGALKYDPTIIKKYIYEISDEDWKNIQLVSN
ncbi:MAG: HU family DNA-binding protein [Gammaproteobacteria bacterium]|nr:HU family DNA-binding protein [Gammaproteobacteria bacterium]